jgi:hypothetical protein
VVVNDGGFWSVDGSQLHFVSSPSNAHGSYNGAVIAGNGSSGAPDVQVTLGGHTYEFLHLNEVRTETGITVNVVDQAGAKLEGALVVIRFADRQVDRVFTDTVVNTWDRIGFAGPATTSVSPPRGYGFAPGQVNPTIVTIVSDQTTQVVIVLAKTVSVSP